MKTTQKLISFFLLIVMTGLACNSRAMPAQNSFSDYYPNNPMVHQVGRQIIDPNGKPLRLRGVNLGGWLHWEGWDFSRGFDISENKIDTGLIALTGPQAVADFHQKIYETFITETDIQRISQLGFNSIRLPINYEILEDDANPYTYRESGWQLIDQALNWCEKYHVYVILDLHSVPGGQSGLPPSNPSPDEPLLWKSNQDKQRTIALWKAIAGRYKDRKIVAGYDLINEPLPFFKNNLVTLQQQIIQVIRQVDAYHMVIVEGGGFSSDFSMFNAPLSGNQMYGFHMYTWGKDNRQQKLTEIKQAAEKVNVPLWAGEFGDNNYDMISSTKAMYEDPANGVTAGWSFWTWKKVSSKYPALNAINVPTNWQAVINWVNQPDKNPQPSAADTQTGMDSFVQAVQLQNTKLDSQMLNALTNGWR